MEENKKKRVVIWVLLIIIIVLLLLIFFAIRHFGQIGLVPTGNVDIFNIICDKDDNSCNCNNSNSNTDSDINNNSNGNTNTSSSSGSNTVNSNSADHSSANNSEEVFNGDGLLNIFDDEINWDSTNELRIFSNPSYEFKDIIAPGSTNAYQFVVNNSQSFPIQYSINFVEDNKDQINMLYKLKRNGEYILGSDSKWVKITDADVKDLQLSAESHDTYSLEWKWVDHDNDTEVAYLEANYSLKINIRATA